MGLFFYTKKGSIISTVDLPTTEIIEPNLNRLVMTRKGRYYDETPFRLEQKLAENIWWLIELANRLNVDIEKEMESFLSEKEQLLKIVNK